jgi:L-Ala-D/L-Glu epimerase
MTVFSPLRIVSSRVLPGRLTFRMDVSHSLASRSYSDNVYVELNADSGVAGYGECVPRSYVTGETPESVIEALPAILGKFERSVFFAPLEVVAALDDAGRSDDGASNPAAMCAAELALLDLAGKRWGVPAGDFLGLGKTRGALVYSLVVPLMPEEKLVRFLAGVSSFRFRHVKIKVDSIDPAATVRRVRPLLPEAEFRVDANCSWSAEEAPGFVDALARERVVSIEQPLPAGELEETARLRGRGVLITLDESVRSEDDVKRAASLGACDMVNVRISKCGGMIGALRIVRAARRCGLEVQLGAQVGESCILSAAGALLASGIDSFRWLEGSFGTHLLTRDLCSPSFRFDAFGELKPPRGPGLGITVDPARIVPAVFTD